MERRLRGCDVDGFYIHETPGDGSCLIHAVIFLLSPTYREFSIEKKREYVLQIREEMASILPEYWSKINITEASKAFPEEYSLEGIQRCLRSKQFLNEFAVWMLEEIFNIRIILYSEYNSCVYERGLLETPRKATIIINYTGSHFESIVCNHRPGSYLLSFHNDNLLLKKILNC